MSHPAHYFIIENKYLTLYTCRTGDSWIEQLLLMGEKKGVEQIKLLDTDIRDDNNPNLGYGDGGIIVDFDNRKLLYFSSCQNIVINRFVAARIAEGWPDWDAKITLRGNFEFAEYLGIYEQYYKEDEINIRQYNDYITWCNNPTNIEFDLKNKTQFTVCTVIQNGCIKDYDLCEIFYTDTTLCEFLSWGEQLVNFFTDDLLITNWKKENHTGSCMLMDFDAKLIYLSDSIINEIFLDIVKNKWQGWSINLQDKGILFHFEYTKRDDSLIKLSEEEFLKLNEVKEIVR